MTVCRCFAMLEKIRKNDAEKWSRYYACEKTASIQGLAAIRRQAAAMFVSRAYRNTRSPCCEGWPLLVGCCPLALENGPSPMSRPVPNATHSRSPNGHAPKTTSETHRLASESNSSSRRPPQCAADLFCLVVTARSKRKTCSAQANAHSRSGKCCIQSSIAQSFRALDQAYAHRAAPVKNPTAS